MLPDSQALDLAIEHHQAGRLQQAEQLYRQILQLDPHQVDALHLLGVVAHQSGRSEEAIVHITQAVALNGSQANFHNSLGAALQAAGKFGQAAAAYQQALFLNPDYVQAHFNLGTVLLEQGKLTECVVHIREALRLKPDHFQAHFTLGVALKKQGQLAEAITQYQRALQLKPNYAEAHNSLGNALKSLGQFDEAIACYHRALQLKPRYAAAYNNLGNAQWELGKRQEAIDSYRVALEIQPNHADAHNNLAIALNDLGKPTEAIASYQRAIELKPDYAEAHNNLGNALRNQGRLAEAAACFQTAVHLKPDYAEAYNNWGILLQGQAGSPGGISYYRRALELKPDYVEAHNNLGIALKDQGRLADATACFQRVLQLRKDYAEGFSNLGNTLRNQGRVAEAIDCYQKAIRVKPDYVEAHNNHLCALHYRDGITLYELAEAHTEFHRHFAVPLQVTQAPHCNDSNPDRRLRIGFLSPDLRHHPVGYFLVRVLEKLDKEQAEAVCYSNSTVNDDVTARIKAAATSWRDVFAWSDEQLSEKIRADRIDILFDLAGHTARNRLLVFARKPAPIQLTWAGYVGTTGLNAIDYIVADRYEIPPEAERFYCERVLRMPDAYVCYDPPEYAPPVSSLPAQKNGIVTFASFNNPAKISAQTVEVWAMILLRLPQARLVLKYMGMDDVAVTDRLVADFARHGLDSGRVAFLGWSPHAEALKHYQAVDIGLDTFPYSGGLTTCEALWMGVPVITWPGETFAGRHSLTHLSNVGLTETIARDVDEYVALAVSLAGNLPHLAELRAGLRQRMASSPLCDGQRFADNLIHQLRQVWREWAGRGAA